jgi:hypothetical protein
MPDERSTSGRTAARRPRLPKLGESLRFYVENTLRARLRSPGIERYRPYRGGLGVRFFAAVVAIGGIAVVLWWLWAR